MERLLAVYKPIQYRGHIMKRSSSLHIIIFILPSFVVSLLLNLPKFFETRLSPKILSDEDNRTLMIINISSLRMDPDYIYYYVHWTRLLGTGIIPFLFLLITNLFIYLLLRRKRPFSVQQSERRVSMNDDSCLQKRFEDGENRCSIVLKCRRISNSKKPTIPLNVSNSAGTLAAIVLMYIICNMPRLVLNLAEYLSYPNAFQTDDCGCIVTHSWLKVLTSISHFLLVVNSSLNFLIYFSIGRRFKMIMKLYFAKSCKNLQIFPCLKKNLSKEQSCFNMTQISLNEDSNLSRIYFDNGETNV